MLLCFYSSIYVLPLLLSRPQLLIRFWFWKRRATNIVRGSKVEVLEQPNSESELEFWNGLFRGMGFGRSFEAVEVGDRVGVHVHFVSRDEVWLEFKSDWSLKSKTKFLRALLWRIMSSHTPGKAEVGGWSEFGNTLFWGTCLVRK